MDLFDLHCDTISECYNKNETIDENNLAIDRKKGCKIEKWIETFAYFIPDGINEEDSFNYYLKLDEFYKTQNINPLKKEVEKGLNGIKMVEGGTLLGKDLKKIKRLKDDDIKIITLTWNGENQIASGAHSNGGLKSFGKEVVKELEAQNIIIDTSHLNEESFYDIMKISNSKKIATHSNSYKIKPHKRNLKDEQIKIIKEQNGIIGLNFYKEFVTEKEENIINDLLRHAYHIMNISSEETLAIGSDFDGADMAYDLKDISKIESLYNAFVKTFSLSIANKVFYENAYNFYRDFFNEV